MKRIFVVMCFVALALVGCTTAQKGAVAGGAAIGAGVGAVAGAMIGEKMETKFCPTCGASYTDDVQFCPKDGAELKIKEK